MERMTLEKGKRNGFTWKVNIFEERESEYDADRFANWMNGLICGDDYELTSVLHIGGGFCYYFKHKKFKNEIAAIRVF